MYIYLPAAKSLTLRIVSSKPISEFALKVCPLAGIKGGGGGGGGGGTGEASPSPPLPQARLLI